MKTILALAVLLFSSGLMAGTIYYNNIGACTSWRMAQGGGYTCNFYPTTLPVVEIQSLMVELNAMDAKDQAMDERIKKLEEKCK